MKWQYATIYYFRGLGGSTLLNLPDGIEQKFPGTLTELTRILNQLGRDGWEVVAVNGETPIWTLKRAL